MIFVLFWFRKYFTFIFVKNIYLKEHVHTCNVMYFFVLFFLFHLHESVVQSSVTWRSFCGFIHIYRLFAPIVNNHIVIFFSTHGGLSWPECSAATGMWGHVTHPWVLCFLVVRKRCGRSVEEGGFGSGCPRNEKTKRLPLKMTWLEMMVFNEQVSEENTRVAVDWKLPLKKASKSLKKNPTTTNNNNISLCRSDVFLCTTAVDFI